LDLEIFARNALQCWKILCWRGCNKPETISNCLIVFVSVLFKNVQTSDIQESRAAAKKTASCRSCSYRFKLPHAFTISLTVDKFRKPRLQSSKHIGAKQNLT